MSDTHSAIHPLALVFSLSTVVFAQTQTFRASTDLVSVDVQVSTRDGEPVRTLNATNFHVWINGHPRRVVSADLVKYPLPKPAEAAAVPSVAAAVSVAAPARVTGRMVILAVDEPSLPPNVARTAMRAARTFIDQLQPEDVVGLYPIPLAPMKLDLRHDHNEVIKTLDGIGGRLTTPSSDIYLGMADVIDVTSNDQRAIQEVQDRECRGATGLSRQACNQQVIGDAFARAAYFESQYMQSLGALRFLLRALGTLPGRKILVLVSGGMATTDRVGGRPDVASMIRSAVEDASASGVVVYVLHLDTTLLDAMSAGVKPSADPSARTSAASRNKMAQARGLERVAGEAGGAVFRDEVGAGEIGFARVLRETSAYYLLGVETTPLDRDGRVHSIRVTADAKGATVRGRSQVLIPVARMKH